MSTPPYAQILSHAQLFHGSDLATLEALLKLGKIKKFSEKEDIVKETEKLSGLSVVLEGYVQVSKGGVPITQIGRGGFFGEMSVFGLTFGATAKISAPAACSVFIIERLGLESWFKQFPGTDLVFYKKLATELCHRLYSTTDKMTSR